MASVVLMVAGTIINAAALTGGNYLAKYLSGDNGQVALDEKIRHDKALKKYQAAYEKWQKDRTELLDWVAEQDREKDKARYDFQTTDQALALYNQTHRVKVALPKGPEFSDFYKPSPQQQNGELLFIGASTLAVRYAAFRLLLKKYCYIFNHVPNHDCFYSHRHYSHLLCFCCSHWVCLL